MPDPAAVSVRQLAPDDQPAIEAFLATRAETSMFLRGNLAASGVFDGDTPHHGLWLGAERDGRIVAVVDHAWAGQAIIQADPEFQPALMRLWQEHASRPLKLIIGPADQVVHMRALLGLSDAPTRLDSREGLFSLPSMDDLQLPDPLARGDVSVRRAVPDDQPLLSAWYEQYEHAIYNGDPGDGYVQRCIDRVVRATAAGTQFVLHDRDGHLLAASTFNSLVGDCAQIGGVWTPPERRGRGHAKAVVAGSLRLASHDAGVASSILFTGEHNAPAIRAYQAIGYRLIGDYYLLGFVEPHEARSLRIAAAS